MEFLWRFFAQKVFYKEIHFSSNKIQIAWNIVIHPWQHHKIIILIVFIQFITKAKGLRHGYIVIHGTVCQKQFSFQILRRNLAASTECAIGCVL